jgi:hypothetical protein
VSSDEHEIAKNKLPPVAKKPKAKASVRKRLSNLRRRDVIYLSKRSSPIKKRGGDSARGTLLTYEKSLLIANASGLHAPYTSVEFETAKLCSNTLAAGFMIYYNCARSLAI